MGIPRNVTESSVTIWQWASLVLSLLIYSQREPNDLSSRNSGVSAGLTPTVQQHPLSDTCLSLSGSGWERV